MCFDAVCYDVWVQQFDVPVLAYLCGVAVAGSVQFGKAHLHEVSNLGTMFTLILLSQAIELLCMWGITTSGTLVQIFAKVKVYVDLPVCTGEVVAIWFLCWGLVFYCLFSFWEVD